MVYNTTIADCPSPMKLSAPALILAASLLAACGGGGETATTTSLAATPHVTGQ